MRGESAKVSLLLLLFPPRFSLDHQFVGTDDAGVEEADQCLRSRRFRLLALFPTYASLVNIISRLSILPPLCPGDPT